MFSSLTAPSLVTCLKEGGVIVIPTDTLYGIVARASDKQAVERIYRLRGRAPEKPCIVLVADHWQITDHALWTSKDREIVARYWPGPLSWVAPVTGKTGTYLHRGTHTLAYRVPAHPALRKLLMATGPLVAPSANPEGQPAATTIAEAHAYFGDTVDGYLDGGRLAGDRPSTVATLRGGRLHIFRQGVLKIS